MAVRDRLRALGVRRLAVATPYAADLTGRVTAALDDMVDVVAVAHLGQTDNRRIGDTSPADITAFVRDELLGTGADAEFISCTNFRAVEALDDLRAVLGVPDQQQRRHGARGAGAPRGGRVNRPCRWPRDPVRTAVRLVDAPTGRF